jgi:hypothetical protein
MMFHLGHYVVSGSVVGVAILALIAVGVAVWSLSIARASQRRISRLVGSTAHPTLEDGLAKVFEEAKEWPLLQERIEVLERKQQKALARTGLVRYNPFDDTGADLSFSLAVLSEDQDGIVLTSLWGRDEVRVYAKPVQKGTSRYALSNEEKQALAMAVNQRTSAPGETKS